MRGVWIEINKKLREIMKISFDKENNKEKIKENMPNSRKKLE